MRRLIFPAVFFALMLCGCRWQPFPETESMHMPRSASERCSFQGTLILNWISGRMTFLVVGRYDPAGVSELRGFVPAGGAAFTVKFRGDRVEYEWPKDTVPPERQKVLSEFIARGFREYFTGSDAVEDFSGKDESRFVFRSSWIDMAARFRKNQEKENDSERH